MNEFIEKHNNKVIIILILIILAQTIALYSLQNQINDIEYTADNAAEKISDLEYEIEKNEIFDKIEDFETRIEDLETNVINLQNDTSDIYLPPLSSNW